jgi:hypothetical protein
MGGEMLELNIDGDVVTDPEKVRDHVTSFYDNLYNARHEMDLDENLFNKMFEVNTEYANGYTCSNHLG